jgi:hypothetical protein
VTASSSSSSSSLQQHGLEAAATIRRAFAAFNQETAEFGVAARVGSVDQMEVARRRAHDYLDAWFDGIAAAYDIGRNDRG